MKAIGIKHTLTPPYHPASNGLAEVAVGIVKGGLKKMEASASPALLQDAVTTMLFFYRMTPNTTTCRTPFELMDSNKVVTPLSLLRPSVQRSNEHLQQQRIQRAILGELLVRNATKYSLHVEYHHLSHYFDGFVR